MLNGRISAESYQIGRCRLSGALHNDWYPAANASLAGGRAFIPKDTFGCRIPAVFRVRFLKSGVWGQTGSFPDSEGPQSLSVLVLSNKNQKRSVCPRVQTFVHALAGGSQALQFRPYIVGILITQIAVFL
jgi:hypothetical protein